MLIISIGTGGRQEPYSYREFKDATKLEWARPSINIMMSGNSETVDYQLKQIYETLPPKDCIDYHRIQPELINGDNAMDNAEPQNLRALHNDGLASVEKNKSELDEIVEKLIANH